MTLAVDVYECNEDYPLGVRPGVSHHGETTLYPALSEQEQAIVTHLAHELGTIPVRVAAAANLPPIHDTLADAGGQAPLGAE